MCVGSGVIDAAEGRHADLSQRRREMHLGDLRLVEESHGRLQDLKAASGRIFLRDMDDAVPAAIAEETDSAHTPAELIFRVLCRHGG